MMTTFNTSPHSTKDEITIQLQIPHQHIGETVNWLVEHSIPFGVCFLQTRVSQLPNINNETQSPLLTTEKISIGASEPNAVRTILEKRISDVFDNYITNGLIQIPPTQEAIAAELNISLPTFKARFRALYGKSFYQVYMDKRMEHAAQLLRQGYKAVEVSTRIGYGEKSCIKFNKMFQKHFGITPKKYQISFK
jgi:AraC-like DNA-binding protein